MGAYYLFQCPKCKYEAEVSGGEDCGYFSHTLTMICPDCHQLVDVITDTIPPHFADMAGKCPNCRSLRPQPWDLVKQPCPKCGKSMKKGCLTAFWD